MVSSNIVCAYIYCIYTNNPLDVHKLICLSAVERSDVRKRGKLFRQPENLFWNTFAPASILREKRAQKPDQEPEKEQDRNQDQDQDQFSTRPVCCQLPRTNDAIEFYEPH